MAYSKFRFCVRMLALGALLASPSFERTASAQACGDGTVDLGEACDDGNNLSGDCCSSVCTREETRYARASQIECLNGAQNVCADGTDNDGDGRVDSDDPGCASLYALQRLAMAATDANARHGLILGNEARVQRTSVQGLTVPGFPVAGVCDHALGVCRCPQALGGSHSIYPDCQSANRACSSDFECELYPYPRGASAAGVCGVNLLLKRDVAVDGFVAAAAEITFGRGFLASRTLQELGAFVSAGGDEVVQGNAPWVGIGLCGPSLSRSCAGDEDCISPDLCADRLQLDDPANTSVDRSGNDVHGNFDVCRRAIAGEIAGVGAAIATLTGVPLSVAANQPGDRIRLRATDPPLHLSFGSGMHVVDIEAMQLARGSRLLLEGQDDTVLVLRVAGALSVGAAANVTVSANSAGMGALSADHLLWYFPGARGAIRIAHDAHFAGTLLFPQRKAQLGSNAVLEGALLGSRIAAGAGSLVQHVPFTGVLDGVVRPDLKLRLVNSTGGDVLAQLSGTRLTGPPPDGGATSYSVVQVLPPGATDVLVSNEIAPGIWLHDVVVASTTQEQFQQSLIVLDPSALNIVDWTLFASVLRVNRADDSGDGVCDATCTLRDALGTAASSPAPVLVAIDHAAAGFPNGMARIDIVQNAALLVQAAGAMIDGTDSLGNPSPVLGFADRTYPTRIVLTAANLDPLPLDCPCNESPAGTLRVQSAGVVVRGLSIERQLAAEGQICCGDQDLAAFDAGSKNSRIESSRLDGGAAAINSAEVPQGETRPATGKDCVDADNTDATSGEPVVVANSELRFCFDRGVKSRRGWLRLEDNWIHHNLRGGIFAQSPEIGSTDVGVAEVVRNLVEHNGQNCPSGDASSCGPLQAVTRSGASELSAQGPYTALTTDGNIVRDGALQGFLFQDESKGSVRNDYVCGINRTSGGKGILLDRATGDAADISVRGTAVVYNDDSGVRLEGNIPGDFGSTTDGGRNAFTQNGTYSRRNFINVLSPPLIVPARGNQWESCYPGSGAAADLCDEQRISDSDTNNTIGIVDHVDVGDPIPHQSTATPAVTGVFPSKAWQGLPLVINGSGFDAIAGHAGRVGGDCSALSLTNTCNPLNGTCVEFLLGGVWTPAAAVLGVTPTALTVRSPVACTQPVSLRVRRRTLDGSERMSNSVAFCTN